MTLDEAKQKLAALKIEDDVEWLKVKEFDAKREAAEKALKAEGKVVMARWHEVRRLENQLESFIEISTQNENNQPAVNQ